MEMSRKNSSEDQKKYNNELKMAQEKIRQATKQLKEAKKNVQVNIIIYMIL